MDGMCGKHGDEEINGDKGQAYHTHPLAFWL